MRLYVGGGTGTPGDPYTVSEFESMLDSGIWKGGFVDGMGNVLAGVSCYGHGGGTVSTSEDLNENKENIGISDVICGILPINKVPGLAIVLEFMTATAYKHNEAIENVQSIMKENNIDSVYWVKRDIPQTVSPTTGIKGGYPFEYVFYDTKTNEIVNRFLSYH